MQLGMGSAVETLCGQAYGAHKYDMLGIYLQRSTILLMATGIPLAVLYAFSRPILVLLGESPEIATAAAVFVYGLIPQIFAYAANFPIQKFMQARGIMRPAHTSPRPRSPCTSSSATSSSTASGSASSVRRSCSASAGGSSSSPSSCCFNA
ncbi:hypothetical protein PR202_ga12537 [Eleusine coracana subsp. coracana]|uniref:Uncharacterized protein n=1 Tax=Eleusine coracana subsp. coracana TaxID=191504 RepID=A0AAV5CBY1_ELECO|nr:hypothetical protein PR202_ga12537 [Eleusine coracana subsp. coracana]